MTYEIVKYNSKGSQGHLWIPENPIGETTTLKGKITQIVNIASK